MASRRVALVVGQLQLGGAERQLFELAVRLDRSRFDPLVVCLSEVAEPFGERLRRSGIEVVTLPRIRHRDPRRVIALASLLRGRSVDLAHSFLIAANAYTWAASRIAGRRTFIASSRTCIPARGVLASGIHRTAFRAADAVIANSRRVMEFTRDRYGVAADRIRIIPNGLQVDAWDAAPGARTRVRRELGIAEPEIVVGTIGRISPEKNLGLFLEVARALAGAAAGPRFVVVGDGPARARLESDIEENSLEGRVLLTGARDDVPGLLAALDIFLTTSDTEGMPNAVMEAMAAGLPVVATRAGGTAEVVLDGETGLLAEPGDARGLIAGVRALAGDPAIRGRLGDAGRRRIEEAFPVNRMVESTVRLYEEVLA